MIVGTEYGFSLGLYSVQDTGPAEENLGGRGKYLAEYYETI